MLLVDHGRTMESASLNLPIRNFLEADPIEMARSNFELPTSLGSSWTFIFVLDSEKENVSFFQMFVQVF
jgi:hypothetical protein